jgi:hypothetical protein
MKTPSPRCKLLCWWTAGAFVMYGKKSKNGELRVVATLCFKKPYCGRKDNTAVGRILPLVLAGQRWKWVRDIMNMLEYGVDSNPLVLGYGLDNRGFESRQGLRVFLLTTASRPALVSTHPPIQWVPGALSLGIKRPGHGADHNLHLVPRLRMRAANLHSPLRLYSILLS